MTYVITNICLGACPELCTSVCPVDCIAPIEGHDDQMECEQLYISPDACVDCMACDPACPLGAIQHEDELPDKLRKFIKINADYFREKD